MDTDRGRKAVGGKIEVRLRTREPLTDKDVQMEKWKWLVIDMHLGGKAVSSSDHVSQGVDAWLVLRVR